jgi:hypothetical protein
MSLKDPFGVLHLEDVELPGEGELQDFCDNARKVAKVCDLLGIEFRGADRLVGLMAGAIEQGDELLELIEDPDNRPYIWDLEE